MRTHVWGIMTALTCAAVLFVCNAQCFAASSSTFDGYYRYEVKGGVGDWYYATENKAYFRDAYAGIQSTITNASDGETWTASVTLVDGTVKNWGATIFYSTYGSQTDCFKSPTWLMPICGSNDITILWYIPSQCAKEGIWNWKLINNGSTYFSGQMKLLPEVSNVPYFSQNVYSQDYDGTCCKFIGGKWQTIDCTTQGAQNCTIAMKGCGITSLAMVMNYHGVALDPPSLNTWLSGNNGYNIEGDVKWYAINKYPGKKVSYLSRTDSSDDTALRANLCGYGPQVVPVKNKSHFVTVTGQKPDTSTWSINDPAGRGWTLNSYGNVYNGMRLFAGAEHQFVNQLSGIGIFLHSPAEFYVVDPQGRRTGLDPITNISYEEIPNASYGDIGHDDDTDITDTSGGSVDPVTKEFYVGRPVDGEYTIVVTGTAQGSYTMEIDALDTTAALLAGDTVYFNNIPVSTNLVHKYSFMYSSTPGSSFTIDGGYDGGGQRPKDVNKFLSYMNPSEARTALAAGTTTFQLVIKYGANIISSSFTARLNSINAGAYFNVVPGSWQIVNLPITSGSNVLVLSVDGTLSSGRTATDTDRLVFIVE